MKNLKDRLKIDKKKLSNAAKKGFNIWACSWLIRGSFLIPLPAGGGSAIGYQNSFDASNIRESYVTDLSQTDISENNFYKLNESYDTH